MKKSKSTLQTERYYRAWLTAIAKGTTAKEIERHIIKHAHEIKDPIRGRPRSWLASMYNLIYIYERVKHCRSSTPEMLYKLGNKYFKYQGWTPPPGKKIPHSVKLVQTTHGPNAVTVKDLRSLGRGGRPRWLQNKKRTT